jgi:hypothetical protein
MNNAAEASKVGVQIALDGRFDRGSTPRHPHHRRHYRHSYSDRHPRQCYDDTEDGRWYARHILTFPAQRATCPAQPVQYRAI